MILNLGFPCRGMGLRILPGEFKAGEIAHALRRLHAEPSFREAAGDISRKLRSRKNTPRQEAAGDILSPGRPACSA